MAKRNFWKNRIKSGKEKGKSPKKWFKKALKVAFLGLIALSIISLLLYGLNLYSYVDSFEFSQDFAIELDSQETFQKYRDKDVFTLLVLFDWQNDSRHNIDAAAVLQIDKNAPEVRVLSFHPDFYFRPYEYGGIISSRFDGELVRVGNLMTIGDLESVSTPLGYPFYQLQELLAIKFDGYLFMDSESLSTVYAITNTSLPQEALQNSESFEDWSQVINGYITDIFDNVSLLRVLNTRKTLSDIQTNLSLKDFYYLISDFKDVEKDSVNRVVFEDDHLREVLNERGERVELLTEQAVDDLLMDFFGDIKVDREQAKVEIFNGSSINGLGGRYGRWVKHLGIDVIRIGTAPGRHEKTVIYAVKGHDFEYTLSKLETLWAGDIQVIEGRPSFVTTGDIILVLGSDFDGN